MNGEVCWRGRRTMKWDQRAADLINPVNEEKTKEAETQLEITNTVQSWYQNSAGFSFRGSSRVRAKQDFTFYVTLPQKESVLQSFLNSVHVITAILVLWYFYQSTKDSLWMRKLKKTTTEFIFKKFNSGEKVCRRKSSLYVSTNHGYDSFLPFLYISTIHISYMT